MEYLRNSIPEMAAGGVQLANILAGFGGKDLEVQVRYDRTHLLLLLLFQQFKALTGHKSEHVIC